mgnify:CR=1 FL=1
MRGRTSRVNSRYVPILGSGVEMPTVGCVRHPATREQTCSPSRGKNSRAEQTMRFIDLCGPGRLGLGVLERVALRLGRVPEDGVVDGRHLDVLDDTPGGGGEVRPLGQCVVLGARRTREGRTWPRRGDARCARRSGSSSRSVARRTCQCVRRRTTRGDEQERRADLDLGVVRDGGLALDGGDDALPHAERILGHLVGLAVPSVCTGTSRSVGASGGGTRAT